MIGGLRPYPKMKASGLPWLGHVPAHWEVLRSKYAFQEVDSRSTTGEETHLSMSQRLGLVPASQVEKSLVSESYIGGKLVQKDDLVLNRLKAHLGVFAYARQAGLVSPDYTVLRPAARANVRFFEFVLKSPTCRAELRTRAKGIVEGFWRLYTDDLYDIRVPVPPLDEQRLIVRFLDWHGGQAAKLIRAKKKIIALLNEQKQAIIHHAVTRGLDPTVKLKTSGTAWLGDLPEHWEVVTMRRVIRRAVDGPHHSPNYLDNGIPFLSARNVRVDRWLLDDVKFISEADYSEFCRRIKPEIGDVLYTKGGTTGVARVVDLQFRFQVWVHIAVLKLLRSKIDPEYLSTTLNSPRCYEQAQLFTRGATNQDLGLGRMKNILLGLPPLSEQRSILCFLRDANQETDRMADAVANEISLIQEFRTRLIADVVTGKLDVRAAASSLSEITESDPIENLVEANDLDDAIGDAENEEVAA